MRSITNTNPALLSPKIRDEEKFLLIQEIITGDYYRMSEYDTLPSNFKLVRKVSGKSCYRLDGQLKDEHWSYPVFDYLRNKENERSFLLNHSIPSSLNHNQLTLIKKVNPEQYFLWKKNLPTPFGFFEVQQYENKPIFHEGVIRAKLLRYPVHPNLLMLQH